MAKGVANGTAIGLNRGFIVTKFSKNIKKIRPSYRKGTLGKRTALVRSIIKEVTGFAPYEKRIIELLKTGTAKDNKKALKLCKARLGTHLRGKKKREELEEVIRLQRKK